MVSSIAVIENSSALDGVMQPWGLKISEDLDWDDYVELTKRIAIISKALVWWVGDWAIYGEETFGDRYYGLTDWLGKSHRYIVDAMSMCRTFQPEQRNLELSPSHHREVRKLPTEQRIELLNKAEESGWTREQIRIERQKVQQTIEKAPEYMSELSLRHTFHKGIVVCDSKVNFRDALIAQIGDLLKDMDESTFIQFSGELTYSLEPS